MSAPMSDERLADIRCMVELAELQEGHCMGVEGRELLDELLLARKQRDEAQREICEAPVRGCIRVSARAVAKERGWDCYPKGEG